MKILGKTVSMDIMIGIIIFFYYTVGILGHAFYATRDFMSLATPYVLFLGGLIVLWRTLYKAPVSLLVWFIGTYLFTFAIEAIGTATGMIFGAYTYGPTLGMHIFDVPLVIGLNWVIVVLGAVTFVRRITGSIVGVVIGTGLLTVLFDIPLEMVAIQLDYWQWGAGYVPLQNYIAWGIIAMVVSYIFCLARLRVRSVLPVYFYIIQFFFFIAIDMLIITGIL